MAGKKTILIGIAGGSGSGKTTICENLAKLLGDLSSRISCDNYYHSHCHLDELARAEINFDHPDTIDFALLDDHLDQLARGNPIEMPDYCFASHTRRVVTTRVESKPIVLVEGILLYANKSVREKFDLRVFVDASDEIRYRRRVARDMRERGRSMVSVERQWSQTVVPMYEAHVEQTRQFAHVTINTEWHPEQSERAIETLASGLREMVT